LRRWATTCLDLIFPPACAACGRYGFRICPECAQQVQPVPSTICERCGRVQPARIAKCSSCVAEPQPVLQQVRAAGLHVEPLRRFIHLLKYEHRPDLAPDLARYLAACLAGDEWQALRGRFDAIAPVPLHADRRRQRGYDQAALLAEGLSSRTGIPLRLDLLERVHFTRVQVGLNAAERRANVKDAFAATAPCARLHVLLIDDVYTTGATLAACAQALHAGGAALVCGLTLAMPSRSQYELRDSNRSD
jgi:ComF family protein